MGYSILNHVHRTRRHVGRHALWHLLVVGLTIASVAGAIAFSGCGGGGSGGLPPGAAGRPGVSGPPGGPGAPKRTVQRTVVATGPKIALAEEIVLAKTNPFLSKLPKINVSVAVATDSGTGQPVVQAADPFAGLTLVGVVFNPSKAIALISVGGSTALLKKGDTFANGAAQLKISSVTRDGVDVVTVGGGEKTTLGLPDIIGYQNLGATSSGSSDSGPEGRTMVDKLNDLIDGTGPANSPRGGLNLQEP